MGGNSVVSQKESMESITSNSNMGNSTVTTICEEEYLIKEAKKKNDVCGIAEICRVF